MTQLYAETTEGNARFHFAWLDQCCILNLMKCPVRGNAMEYCWNRVTAGGSSQRSLFPLDFNCCPSVYRSQLKILRVCSDKSTNRAIFDIRFCAFYVSWYPTINCQLYIRAAFKCWMDIYIYIYMWMMGVKFKLKYIKDSRHFTAWIKKFWWINKLKCYFVLAVLF